MVAVLTAVNLVTALLAPPAPAPPVSPSRCLSHPPTHRDPCVARSPDMVFRQMLSEPRSIFDYTECGHRLAKEYQIKNVGRALHSTHIHPNIFLNRIFGKIFITFIYYSQAGKSVREILVRVRGYLFYLHL